MYVEFYQHSKFSSASKEKELLHCWLVALQMLQAVPGRGWHPVRGVEPALYMVTKRLVEVIYFKIAVLLPNSSYGMPDFMNYSADKNCSEVEQPF